MAKQMTGRERVLAALNGQDCDRPCWSPLIDNYFTSSLAAQGLPRGSWADAYRLAGADIVERHAPAVTAVEDETITRRVTRTADRETEVIETPVGQLVTERGTNAWEAIHVTRFPIQTLADVQVWDYVVAHTHYRAAYDDFKAHDAQIGADGIATPSGPFTPLMALMEDLCGIQTAYYLLADYPDEMQALMDRMHALNLQAYRLLADSPAQVIITYEDTSSTILSPAVYRRHCAPRLDEYAQICRAGGKLHLVHMCGKLSAFNPQLKAGQMAGIESVCPPTTGDIWPHEARAAWGAEKIIFGGLEPAALERMTEAETRRYAAGVLDGLPTFRRFILGTGDATAHGTPMANLRAISEVVQDYPWR